MSHDTNTTGTDARQAVADQLIDGYGANYFNPLIGKSAGETCAKVESVMALLRTLTTKPDLIDEDTLPGITALIQTVWAATQYESNVFDEERNAA